MKVTTKFDIGDEVWFIANNKVLNDQVRCVNVILFGKSITIKYTMSSDRRCEEFMLFRSKKELIESL